MTTVEELRQHCQRLALEREEELKEVIEDYFLATFIAANRPFRAVIGNRKCRPVPIHQTFIELSCNELLCHEVKWPNLSEELIRKGLENLGFVITKQEICVSVPPYKKGSKMTFAQEWVKKINDNYSDYCAYEKKKAKEAYSEFIAALVSVPKESIMTFDEFTLFCDFKFEGEITKKCLKFLKKMLVRDGIEEYFENGEYKGIRVFNNPSN